MNNAWIWQYIILGEGGSHNVDKMLGGVITKWWYLITKGGCGGRACVCVCVWGRGGGGQESGVKNLGESYYIISECLLTM